MLGKGDDLAYGEQQEQQCACKERSGPSRTTVGSSASTYADVRTGTLAAVVVAVRSSLPCKLLTTATACCPANCSCTACRHRLQMSTSIVCRPSHRAYNAQALILSPTAWCVPVCRPCCSTCVAAAACWTTGTCGAAASVPGLRWCGGAARCSSWLTCSWDRRRACAPASPSACRGAARAAIATCGCGYFCLFECSAACSWGQEGVCPSTSQSGCRGAARVLAILLQFYGVGLVCMSIA